MRQPKRQGPTRPRPQGGPRRRGALAVNLHELEAQARSVVSTMAFEYVAGGSADEITMRDNRQAWDRLRLEPRVLVDVGAIDTGLELLGRALPFPIALAPAGFQRLLHPAGEVATARAAGTAGGRELETAMASCGMARLGAIGRDALWRA